MPSQLKSDTARANGAKSRGPKSAATREISSRNSLRHGLSACNTLLLACESREDFELMLAEYNSIHLPATLEENGLVREMVAARWRIQRLWTAETSLIDLEMIRQQSEGEKKFARVDSGILLGVSIRSLADESRCLSLISRYESRLNRIHERARRTLRELQKARKNQSAEPASAQACAPPEPPALRFPGAVTTSQPQGSEPNVAPSQPEAATNLQLDGAAPPEGSLPAAAPSSQPATGTRTASNPETRNSRFRACDAKPNPLRIKHSSALYRHYEKLQNEPTSRRTFRGFRRHRVLHGRRSASRGAMNA
jgi:hypothetical protein